MEVLSECEIRWDRLWPRGKRIERTGEKGQSAARFEDLFGGQGGAIAVPVRVIEKVEIFFLVEKKARFPGVAVCERDGADAGAFESDFEIVKRVERRGDVVGLSQKWSVDSGAVGNEENHQIETIFFQLGGIPGEIGGPALRGQLGIGWRFEFGGQEEDGLAIAEFFLDDEGCKRVGE